MIKCKKCGSIKINIVAGKRKCEHCGNETKAPRSRFFGFVYPECSGDGKEWRKNIGAYFVH